MINTVRMHQDPSGSSEKGLRASRPYKVLLQSAPRAPVFLVGYFYALLTKVTEHSPHACTVIDCTLIYTLPVNHGHLLPGTCDRGRAAMNCVLPLTRVATIVRCIFVKCGARVHHRCGRVLSRDILASQMEIAMQQHR